MVAPQRLHAHQSYLQAPHGTGRQYATGPGESVENEWLCAQILAAYGMPVAACRPLMFENQKVLCVERFDRMWSKGSKPWLIRLPQE